MKIQISIPLCLLALAALPALASPGGDGTGNGGAGVEHNGRLATFYSAGLYVEPAPKAAPQDVPSLPNVVSAINSMSFLSDDSKATLVDVILPSPHHQYFAAQADQFDDATMARLLAEFHRVTGVTTDDLRLFALTDTNSRQTFLLPGYFKLSPNDQAAILFHEAYWLLHPDATYNTVVAAEMAFEAVLDRPNDNLRIMDFMQYYSNRGDQILFAVNADRASGALKGFLDKKNRLDLRKLFGSDFIKCYGNGTSSYGTCDKYFNINLSSLMTRYPNSAFLKLVQDTDRFPETIRCVRGDDRTDFPSFEPLISFSATSDPSFNGGEAYMPGKIQYADEWGKKTCNIVF